MSLKSAVFTICQNEPVFFPIWLRFYSKFFDPEDIYVLHHRLPSRNDQWEDTLHEWKTKLGFQETVLENDISFNHDWLRDQVQSKQRELLKHYGAVLFTEIDEIVTTRPGSMKLQQYIDYYLTREPWRVCTGYEIVHKFDEESPLILDQPLLPQRRWWCQSYTYSKPLLSRVPLNWCWGFHHATDPAITWEQRDENLLLIHLHKIDFDVCLSRNVSNASRKWANDWAGQAGFQNRIIAENNLKSWWHLDVDTLSPRLTELLEIPPEVKTLL